MIRPMTEADDKVVAQISTICYRFAVKIGDFDRGRLQDALDQHCTVEHVSAFRVQGTAMVAEENSQVAGVIVVKGNSIQALFVEPEFHRHGIGRSLFHNAEDVIARAGHFELCVRTTQSAAPFYLAMGMRPVGLWYPQQGPFSGMELLEFRKSIGPQPDVVH